MATPDSTTPPSQPSSPRPGSSEWALLAGAHLSDATRALLLAIEKASSLELRAALCAALVEIAKLWGVLEWLGEEFVVLTEGGAQ